MKAVSVAVPVEQKFKAHRGARPAVFSGPSVRTEAGVEKQRKENEERRERERKKQEAAAKFMLEKRKEEEKKKENLAQMGKRHVPHPAHRQIVDTPEAKAKREEINRLRNEDMQKRSGKGPEVKKEEKQVPKDKEEEVKSETVEEAPAKPTLRSTVKAASKK
jgi:hypothetical protein